MLIEWHTSGASCPPRIPITTAIEMEAQNVSTIIW